MSWSFLRVLPVAAAAVALSACGPDPIEPSPVKPSEDAVQTPPQLIPPIQGGSDFRRQQIVRFFAPVIYQDIEDHSEADLFSRVTFDGNWNGADNWKNTFSYPKRAYVYTSFIEDANRIFLHYGLFYPRDWCSVTCAAGQDYHENDMEGLSLVVDKRFVASGWPYGQALTIDTRTHNGFGRYRNCSLSGGYANYVRLPSGLPAPCFQLKAGFNSTAPSPPSRVAIFVDAQTHATRALGVSDYPFAGGDGVVYFPTDRVAEVPASTATTTQTAYTVQWMDSTEVVNWSLWSQRRNTVIGGSQSIFNHDNAGTVGPHDVYYLKFFACGQPYCPSLAGTRAKAPWGIQGSSAERRGEWHNHPAWSWSRNWAPVGATPYYEYTCQSESCRKNNTYVHNIYWDDTPWSGGGTGGPGGPPCTGCPKTSAGVQTAARRLGAERRWDFDDARAVQLAGDATARALSIPDDEWGYSGGQMKVLRVEGRGEARLTFKGPFPAERYSQLIARVRRLKGRPASIVAEWVGTGQTRRQAAASGALVLDQAASKSWEILTLPLADLPAWSQLESVERLTLRVELDGGQSDAVDIDFVVLAP